MIATRKFYLAILAGLLLLCAEASAAEIDTQFEAANKLYEEGHYSEAAQAYEKTISTGQVSEPLYFNCGNAWFKQGKIGLAIAAYHKGQHLFPRDLELDANLQIARTQARGGDPYPASRLQKWLNFLSLNEWTLVACASWWAICCISALSQWRPQQSVTLRRCLRASQVLLWIFGICFVTKLHDEFAQKAIVITGETDVRNGPLDESQSVFKVRDGIELKVLDQKDGWLQVKDSTGRTGWMPKDQTILFPIRTSARSKN